MGVLREMRMRQAAMLLANGDYQIEQVAHLVGYTNRSSFCRAFRDFHMVHPSAYLKREREGATRAAAAAD